MNINDLDFEDSRVQEFLSEQESGLIRSPEDFRFEVLESFNPDAPDTGIRLPWSKTHEHVRLREGEVSVWAGINGHMKSMLLGQVAMFAASECTVGIASFEMPVAATLRRMAQQASGSAQTEIRFANDFITWANDRMWFYNRLDSVPPARVLGCVLHMGKELGCKLVVVDSLMMCGVSDDMERERRFMATLTGLARSLKIHIALVHHVRKPQKGDDSHVPSRFDVKGNGAIVDLASTLFICWNDKRKREISAAREAGHEIDDDELDYFENAPDQLLVVAKQRNARFEGTIALWMNDAMQFLGTKNRSPIPFDIPRLA